MTTRPTPERLKEIRFNCYEWNLQTWQEVFAEIDALTAGRDKYHDDFIATARRECAFEKELDQWRAYAEELRGALEFYSRKRTPTTGIEARIGIAPIDYDNGERAREALALTRPGVGIE